MKTMALKSRETARPFPTHGGEERNVTVVERAFQLARSGRCSAVQEIRYHLKIEGYSDAQVTGLTLLRQLRALIKASRTGTAASAGRLK
ncbi:protein of unknown function [Hyphomicrobium sp. MC1]|nr:protein of unknown function [Hyphomicrobium sp. MC1]